LAGKVKGSTRLGRLDTALLEPKRAKDCPFGATCRSRRCEAKKPCVRIKMMVRAAERAYRSLPQFREEYAPLVHEAVFAQLVLAALDHKLRRSGLTSRRKDGKLKPNELLRERRQWASLLVRLHSEMCLTPRSLSAKEKAGQPTGLLAATLGADVLARADASNEGVALEGESRSRPRLTARAQRE